MRLEDFNLVARSRVSWEAADLGFVMVRTWRAAAAWAWFLGYVVPALVALALIPTQWSVLVAWWLKPLGDRLLLKVFSESVFGAVPSRQAVLKSLRESLLSRSLWADLTYRRFSPLRSFNLCVTQLERQRGQARHQRINALRRGGGDAAFSLLAMCSLFVMVLFLGENFLLYVFLPEDVIERNNVFQIASQSIDGWFGYVLALFYFVAESLVEPYYVAAGFSLYLNRRTQLEGWDIELSLRALATRLEASGFNGVRALRDAAAIAFVCIGLGIFHPTQAATAAASNDLSPQKSKVAAEDRKVGTAVPLSEVPPGVDAARGHKLIGNILAQPDFGHNEPDWGWELHNPPPKEEESNAHSNWLEGWRNFVGAIARSLSWLGSWGVRGVIVIALALFLAFVLSRLLPLAIRRARVEEAGPPVAEMFGLDLRPERLPSDIPGTARKLAVAGDIRAALALLYRGALVAVVRDGRIRLARGDTEERCLERVRSKLGEPVGAWFGRLVGAWQQTAYAHRPASFPEVEALCGEWAVVERRES